MKIICQTSYDRRALAAMSLAVRKTLRRRFNRLICIYLLAVAVLLLFSILLSLDNPPRAVLCTAVLVLLAAAQLKQDAINAFFARWRSIPGTEKCCTVFYSDCYVVTFPSAETKWGYDRILLPVETRDYFVLILGKAHAHAISKSGLDGIPLEAFRAFLSQKTGKPIQKVGGWDG